MKRALSSRPFPRRSTLAFAAFVALLLVVPVKTNADYDQGGYEAGYEGGYESAYESGYESGYEGGYESGYESGYGGGNEYDSSGTNPDAGNPTLQIGEPYENSNGEMLWSEGSTVEFSALSDTAFWLQDFIDTNGGGYTSSLSSDGSTLTVTASNGAVATVVFDTNQNNNPLGSGGYSESAYSGDDGSADASYGESAYAGDILGGGGSPAVTVALTATPLSVQSGGTSRLTWTSTNATSCTSGSFGFSTGGATNNSVGVVVGPLTAPGPWPFQINCTGPGAPNSDSKIITINNSMLYAVGNPSRVNSGDQTQIAWSAAALPASSACTLTRNGSAWAPVGGNLTANSSGVLATSTVSDTITVQTIYKLICNGVVYQAIVNMNGQVKEF